MENVFRSFEVNKICFNNFSDEMSMAGTMFQENLSFETILKLPNSMMNLVINKLQKQNPDSEITSLIETETLPGDEINYSICLSEFNNLLAVSELIETNFFKQIRA
jgi:hypothetical protein